MFHDKRCRHHGTTIHSTRILIEAKRTRLVDFVKSFKQLPFLDMFCFCLLLMFAGTYQKRFVCIVPHMFLYYYDVDSNNNSNNSAPRGVIDLQYFNKVKLEGPNRNILKLESDHTNRFVFVPCCFLKHFL